MSTATLDSTVCPSCNGPIDRGTRFCGRCGRDLITGVVLEYEDAYEQGPRRGLIWAGVAFAGLTILVAFVFSLAAFLSEGTSTGADPELAAAVVALRDRSRNSRAAKRSSAGRPQASTSG